MTTRNEHQVSRRAWIAILLGILIVSGFSSDRLGLAQAPAQAPLPSQPAEQVFKNIQVLKGMPAADLQGDMSFIASSLGVDCDYCHVQAFEEDSPPKVRAREMILMMRRINQETFRGENRVTCFTCHQGGTAPVSMANVLLLSAPRPATAPPTSAVGEVLPTVQQILDHYVQALGGQPAVDAVKTRVIKTAPLGGASSDSSLNELFQKVHGKVLVFRQSQGYTSWAGFNGQQAWAQDSLNSYWGLLNTSQLDTIMRDSEMYPGSRISTHYKNVVVAGKEQINNHATFIVAGTSPEGVREKFYFDTRTGLLLRRHIEEPTSMGWFPLDVNFEGYREVDGVKIPFVVRLSSAGGAWGVQTSYVILEVHQNVPIDDDKFNHPTPVE